MTKKTSKKTFDEKSAGAVVYYKNKDGQLKCLLLQKNNFWDFPKGNNEKNESEQKTAVREVKEETGIGKIVLDPKFKQKIEYKYKKEGRLIHKQVVYFLAKAKNNKVKISYEHQGFIWTTFDEAIKIATFENSKKLLKKAYTFLTKTTREKAA